LNKVDSAIAAVKQKRQIAPFDQAVRQSSCRVLIDRPNDRILDMIEDVLALGGQ